MIYVCYEYFTSNHYNVRFLPIYNKVIGNLDLTHAKLNRFTEYAEKSDKNWEYYQAKTKVLRLSFFLNQNLNEIKKSSVFTFTKNDCTNQWFGSDNSTIAQ